MTEFQFALISVLVAAVLGMGACFAGYIYYKSQGEMGGNICALLIFLVVVTIAGIGGVLQ